jgi:hypothetical protein
MSANDLRSLPVSLATELLLAMKKLNIKEHVLRTRIMMGE